MLKMIPTVLVAVFLFPSAALAHWSVEHQNRYLRARVISLHGKSAPGRDIIRRNLTNGKRPSHKQIRRYLDTLRRMIHPVRAVTMLVPRAPRQPPAGTATLRAPAGGTLSRIAQCESGGNPSTNTGNGFYGKYQFTQSTWQSVGGAGNPAAASESEQDRRAAILYARSGSAPWPVCGR